MTIRLLPVSRMINGETENQRARRITHEAHIVMDLKRAQARARGADRDKFDAEMTALERVCREYADEDDSRVSWREIATQARRVEREATKLRFLRAVPSYEAACIQAGVAVREGAS